MPAWLAWTLLIPLALVCGTGVVRRAGHPLGAMLDRAARTPGAGEALVFMIALLLGAIPTLLNAVPPPSTHDEFAYLLAADTFRQGRLTNVTHPLWEHFETFHQILQPTYMAKFPPGQGLALAAGMSLGAPIIGAWGTIALACAAICWMLRAILPDRWAVIGGLIAATHPLIFWWGQIYWGGGVALLGGALVVGAMIRCLDRPRTRWGLVAGLGIAVLANSRPFEGALLTLILGLILLVEAARRSQFGAALASVVVPACLVLVPVAALMGYYNWRVTGDALTLPYVVHARQYMASPLLWFQSAPPRPEYRHRKLEQYYAGYEFDEYHRQTTPRGFVEYGLAAKWREIGVQWLSAPTLAAALLMLPLAMSARRNPAAPARRAARVSVAICVGFPLLHMFLTPWLRMQYLAPVGSLYFAAVTVALRQWTILPGRGRRLGVGVASAVALLQFTATGWSIVQMVQNPNPAGAARARIVDQLRSSPGRHVVLVRYGEGPQSIFEWVYNDADIDGSSVVFARDLGDERNRPLLEYFADRRFWLLNVDGNRYDFGQVTPSTAE